MYELSRVRLRSVGPTGARFPDIVLDLRGAGRPVEHHQDSVFGDAAPVLRPSPATVILLENGGGKSVLLKLIFSVLLPDRRQTLGTTNTRVLDNFVLAKDVSHIVLEWMDVSTGKLLLTGKVMEWRQQSASAAIDALKQQWYCLRPNDGMSLDVLPFKAAGQPLRMAAYKRELHEAYAADQSLELAWFSHQGDWKERLQQLDIDPELFRYQRAMNVDEGEAANALTLDSDAKFVEFLLGVVVRTKELDPLAALVNDHVQRLANRGALVTERAFVAGALDLLGPVDAAGRALKDSVRAYKEAELALARFAAQVRARAEVEEGKEEVLGKESERTRKEVALAARHKKECEDIQTELSRLLAEMRLSEANALVETCDRQLVQAQEEWKAWEATPKVLEHDVSAAAVKDLTALVVATEEKARPALKERDDAARRLARALLAGADEAAAVEATELEQRDLHKEKLATARATARDELKTAVVAENTADGCLKDIAEVMARVSDAVTEGLLSEAEALPSRLREVRDELGKLRSRIADLEKEREELTAREATTQDELREAAEEAAERKQARDKASSDHEEAVRRTRDLENEPRTLELLDSEQADFDRDAEELRRRLSETLSAAERDITALNAAEYADERARLALADGELLPPPEVIGDACALLKDAGIIATSGWQYLAGIPDLQRRREWVRRSPHLAAGVILNDPADLPKAESLLAELRPQPTVHVAVATTRAFGEAGADPIASVATAIPLHPALHDPEAAAAEHRQIELRHAERISELMDLQARRTADQRLLHRVEEWRAAYPVGSLAALEQKWADTRRLHAQALDIVTACQTALKAVQNRRGEVGKELPELYGAEKKLDKQERQLADLSVQTGRVPALAEKEKNARAQAEAHHKKAEEAEKLAEQHQTQVSEHGRSADEARRTVRSLNERRAKLPGGEEVPVSDPVPDLSIALLDSAYAQAVQNYTRVEVGSDLLKEKSDAEGRAARANAAYLALGERVRVRAAALLKTPQGSEESARAAQTDSAERLVKLREKAKENAVVARSRCGDQFDEATKRVTSRVLLPEAPADIPRCIAAAEHAAARSAAALQAHAECEKEHVEAEQRLEEAQTAARSFRFITGTVAGDTEHAADAAAPGSVDVEPYSRDAESAQYAYTVLRKAVTSTATACEADERALEERAGALQRHATAAEFKDLLLPVQSQIRVSGWQTTAARAGEWAEALHPRLLSLDEDLEQTEVHRRLIVDNLRGLVSNALNTLRRAQRVSRLPDTLGDWSGEEFLRFRFRQTDDVHLTEALAQVIDEAAAGQNTDGRTVKRDGMSLLLRGVRAAVPRGFHVEVLKPDAVLRTERVRVSEIKDVFSGGQVLTAAILLYCTMAALRANDRGHVRHTHSGVLFLDNPIGRANADYLLDLQRKVAEALGVQLIYTTGLSDDNTLKRFPLVLRLRNDADLRTGRKYLTVAQRVQEQLDALDAPDGGGRITATRIMHLGADSGASDGNNTDEDGHDPDGEGDADEAARD